MTDADDIQDAIVENAVGGVKSAEVDGVRTEAHSIDDQIKAAKWVAQTGAAAKPKVGVRYRKFIPPGTV